MRVTSAMGTIPGAKQILEGVWWLPGQKKAGRIASAALLLTGAEPVLVDAGMHDETARALREMGIVQRLHLTHMHLDHRMHQNWFATDEVTGPAAERDAIADWNSFFEYSGFPDRIRTGFEAWRRATCDADTIPHIRGLAAGEHLVGCDVDARLLPLPGHTAGHSGLWFPELRAALVTDYDMEAFGPWYGNRSSDLTEWITTLEDLLARDDLDWFITSHSRGMLPRDQFEREAARYLRLIEERDEAIVALLADGEPRRADDLVGCGVMYPPKAVMRMPVFRIFERRMIELHLERLEQRGVVAREEEGWRCV